MIFPPSPRFARRSSFASQVAYVHSHMPTFVAFWLPEGKDQDAVKQEREVSDALGAKIKVSSVRIVPRHLGLPLHGTSVVVLVARQVDMQDPAPIMALLSSSGCAPLDILLKSVDTATEMGWRMIAESRRSSGRREAVGVDSDSICTDLWPHLPLGFSMENSPGAVISSR